MKKLLLLILVVVVQGLPAPYRVLVLPYNVQPPVHLNTSEFETYNLPPTRTPKQIIETRFEYIHIVGKLLKMSHLNFGIFHQFLSY